MIDLSIYGLDIVMPLPAQRSTRTAKRVPTKAPTSQELWNLVQNVPMPTREPDPLVVKAWDAAVSIQPKQCMDPKAHVVVPDWDRFLLGKELTEHTIMVRMSQGFYGPDLAADAVAWFKEQERKKKERASRPTQPKRLITHETVQSILTRFGI